MQHQQTCHTAVRECKKCKEMVRKDGLTKHDEAECKERNRPCTRELLGNIACGSFLGRFLAHRKTQLLQLKVFTNARTFTMTSVIDGRSSVTSVMQPAFASKTLTHIKESRAPPMTHVTSLFSKRISRMRCFRQSYSFGLTMSFRFDHRCHGCETSMCQECYNTHVCDDEQIDAAMLGP